MTQVAYNQGEAQLQQYVTSLKKELDHEEITRKKQDREIQILGQMERDIRKKLSLLENTLEKIEKKNKKKGIVHQRSTSNPEDATTAAIEQQRMFNIDQAKTHSSDDQLAHKPLQRASHSYVYRRVTGSPNQVTPEPRKRQVETSVPRSHEIQSHHQHTSAHNLTRKSNGYSYEMQRPQTSSSVYPHYAPSQAPNKNYSRTKQIRPPAVVKAMSTGVTSMKSRNADNGFETKYERIPHSITSKTISSGALNPREVMKARIANTHQTRSSSAFGMYKTSPSVTNYNSTQNYNNEEIVHARPIEMRRKVPTSLGMNKLPNERAQSMENLVEKRPLAKTNSTILKSSDFKIISLESRTIAQQIKLKELEKKYLGKNRILDKTEWVSFVSNFSETQKEVRNLDIEWQELFSELMARSTEYNEHMNEIRMWVNALKVDSRFLQDIMSNNLMTPL